ncbi:MAG: glycosyltransferase family 4 protein [Bacteroidota bacterium]
MTTAGLIHYGLGMGRALQQTAGIEAVSIFEQGAAQSRIARDILSSLPHHTYPFRTLFDKLMVVMRIIRVVYDFKPDIVHFTDGVERPVYGFLLFPILKNLAPIVVTVHDPVPHSGVRLSWAEERAKSLAYHCTRHFVVHGPFCQKLLLEQAIRPECISIQRHGAIDFLGEHTEDTRREPQTILFFGRFQPNKGMDFLVPVADQVHSLFPRALFLVVGSMGTLLRGKARTLWERELRPMLAAMRKRSYFEVYEGFVPDERIGHYFQRATITLLPYRDATQSGVATIAMSFQTAIVATNVGDLAQLIRHNETGLLCRTDVESISDAVCDLLGNPEKTRRLAQLAKEHTGKHFTWAAVARETAEMYKHILSSQV